MKILSILLLPLIGWGVTNSLTITETNGTSTSNYPIQIGRPFMQGEITNYPQVKINGSAVATQADVKQRWPDGSVKHAILAFLVPTLSANATITITFQNQGSGNNTALTLVQMQNVSYDFNAQMVLTNGSTLTADARTMLNAGSYSLWTSGSVAQTIILADHTNTQTCNSHACSLYDIGFDTNKSFRPIFHATFWPTINKVSVRYIGEIAQSESLQDQTFSLALTRGNASPSTWYTHGSFTHYAMSRWTKTTWIGTQPTPIAIDHNLPYLIATTFIPSIDTSIVVPSGTITADYATWTSDAKDLYDAGDWALSMGQGGEEPFIGIYPVWHIKWLLTFDNRELAQAAGDTDLAGAYPFHFREGKSGKILRTGDTGSTGMGHVLSIAGRPTSYLEDLTRQDPGGVSAGDKVNPVGTCTTGGWTPDAWHWPDPWTPLYTLTGDFWYLEEAWFGHTYQTANSLGGATTTYYGRGPTGAEGGFRWDNTRIRAWLLRSRAHEIFVTPDAAPEKAYFNDLMNGAIAIEEGEHNITTTSFNGNANWTWGHTYRLPSVANGASSNALGPPTLHQYLQGSSSFVQPDYGIDTSTVQSAEALFEYDYMILALGRAKELGFPTGALLTWASYFYTGALTDSNYNPYLIENGRYPTVRLSDGAYFSSWANLKTGYNSTWQNETSFSTGGNPNGYAAYATAAVSFISGETNGVAAWNFMDTHYNQVYRTNIISYPLWALVPRVGVPTLTGNSVVSGARVQGVSVK